MKAKEIEEREEEMSPVIGSKPLHSETTDVFMVSQADYAVRVEGREGGWDLYLASGKYIGAQRACEMALQAQSSTSIKVMLFLIIWDSVEIFYKDDFSKLIHKKDYHIYKLLCYYCQKYLNPLGFCSFPSFIKESFDRPFHRIKNR